MFVAALGDEKVVAIDLETGAVRSAPLGPQPYHLAIIRGTDKIYVSSATETRIFVVDQKSLKVINEIEIGGKGHQMAQ